MPRRPRRQYTPEQKAAILRRHLVDKVPVSNLCNEYELQPSLFYSWLKLALENLQGALAPSAPKESDRRERELAAENTQLKARLAKKDSVIAEISAEYVQLKKALGEP